MAHAQIYAGRPIRRLVSFFDSARAMVDENDRRAMLALELELAEGEAPGHVEANTIEWVEQAMLWEAGRLTQLLFRQERLFRGYQQLLLYVPLVKATVEHGEDLQNFFKNVCTFFHSHWIRGPDSSSQIVKGSDMARGDDTSSLKIAVVEWVHEIFGTSTRRLEFKHKAGRGIDHDHCGKLLCPVEFDWSDLR
jgi:hypothetical protein